MSANKLEVFDVTVNEATVKLAVIKPTREISSKAQLVYNKFFHEVLKNGGILSSKLNSYAIEQGIWDEGKEKTRKVLIETITEGMKTLSGKNGKVKVTDAVALAKRMMLARHALQALMFDRNQLEVNSAEGQAEAERFNYLVSQCLVYNDTGKPYFSSVDEYLSDGTNPAAIKGFEVLGTFVYGVDKDAEANLPENKFLKEWGYLNDELKFINKDGNLTDIDGKRVDEQGRYIDDDGNLINVEGLRVTAEGEFVVDGNPFIDDDGNPAVKPAKNG